MLYSVVRKDSPNYTSPDSILEIYKNDARDIYDAIYSVQKKTIVNTNSGICIFSLRKMFKMSTMYIKACMRKVRYCWLHKFQ